MTTAVRRTLLKPRTRRGDAVGDLPESVFQRRILKLAFVTGWLRHYHTFDSINSPSGFPDLVLVNRRLGRVLWAEIKSEHGRLRWQQQGWIDDLRACGQEAYVWRPSDWPEILRVLGAA